MSALSDAASALDTTLATLESELVTFNTAVEAQASVDRIANPYLETTATKKVQALIRALAGHTQLNEYLGCGGANNAQDLATSFPE